MRRVLPLSLLVIPLAACAGDPPAPSSPVTTTMTATETVQPAASPSVVTPRARPSRLTLPPQAARNDTTGAAATVRYYFQAVDHAFATGDVSALRAVSTATNRTTADFVERAAVLDREGAHPLGDTQQVGILSARTRPTGSGAGVEVTLRYASPRVEVQDGQGQVTQVAAVPARTVVVSTQRVGDRWLVESVTDPAARPTPAARPLAPAG